MSGKKRGMSAVIVTLILVALSIALIAVVWTVVSNIVNGQIGQAGACYGNYDKITLNHQYSCYGASSPQYVQFSLKRGDIDLNSVIVSISGEGGSKTVTITSNATAIANLKPYGSGNNFGDPVTLPSKNAGSTYVYNWTESYAPTSIEISPVISGSNCGISDSISALSDCRLLA